MATPGRQQVVPNLLDILVFSWDAGGLRICENADQAEADNNRRPGVLNYLTGAKPCLVADWLNNLAPTISGSNPEMVFFATQDESTSGSYLHSDRLPIFMNSLGYKLLKKQELTGVGEAASGLVDPNIVTGAPSGSSLRSSIYVPNAVHPQFVLRERQLGRLVSNNGSMTTKTTDGSRTLGAIASYVWHPRHGHFALLNVDFPTGSSIAQKGTTYQDRIALTQAINHVFTLQMMDTLVNSLPAAARPNYVIIAGDLGSDFLVAKRTNLEMIQYVTQLVQEKRFAELQTVDYLSFHLKLHPFTDELRNLTYREGPGDGRGSGPLFAPTWRLRRNRPPQVTSGSCVGPSCYEIDQSQERTSNIAWKDRILFGDYGTRPEKMSCVVYDRLDVDGLTKSNHAAVWGVYRLS